MSNHGSATHLEKLPEEVICHILTSALPGSNDVELVQSHSTHCHQSPVSNATPVYELWLAPKWCEHASPFPSNVLTRAHITKDDITDPYISLPLPRTEGKQADCVLSQKVRDAVFLGL